MSPVLRTLFHQLYSISSTLLTPLDHNSYFLFHVFCSIFYVSSILSHLFCFIYSIWFILFHLLCFSYSISFILFQLFYLTSSVHLVHFVYSHKLTCYLYTLSCKMRHLQPDLIQKKDLLISINHYDLLILSCWYFKTNHFLLQATAAFLLKSLLTWTQQVTCSCQLRFPFPGIVPKTMRLPTIIHPAAGAPQWMEDKFGPVPTYI